MSSETIEVVLQHEHPPSAGMLTFDGAVVEIFGFGLDRSVRLHIRQIAEVELNEEGGVFAAPCLRFEGRLGSDGWTQVIDPAETDWAPLERFAAAVEAAIPVGGEDDA